MDPYTDKKEAKAADAASKESTDNQAAQEKRAGEVKSEPKAE